MHNITQGSYLFSFLITVSVFNVVSLTLRRCRAIVEVKDTPGFLQIHVFVPFINYRPSIACAMRAVTLFWGVENVDADEFLAQSAMAPGGTL